MKLNAARRLLAVMAVSGLLLVPPPAAAQEMVAYPDTYDFYTVYIGQSDTMTGTLTNENGGTIFVTGWEWTYNPLGAFEVTSGLTLPAPVPSHTSVDYQVTFTPPDFSFWNATLRFHTSSPFTPYVDIQFWGFGDYDPGLPDISVWPTALDFGTVSMGDEVTQTTTITNSGGGELVVNLSIAGSVDFGFAPGTLTSFTLSGGQAQDVVLRYAPSDIGDDFAGLVIAHNDPDLMDDIVVPLSGTGLPMAADCDLAVSTDSLDFGDVLIGNTSTLGVMLDNTGTGDCTVYDLELTGSSEFMRNAGVPVVPFQVFVGGPSVDVDIDYTPIDGGNDSGELSIGSDDPDSPEQLISLSGSGVFSMVDVDVRRLWARRFVRLSRGRPIWLGAMIRNNGDDEGDRLVRLTGVQRGETVYTHSRLAGDPVGGFGTWVRFPSYTPIATGRIEWTLVIFDDDPDDDTVTATTRVLP